LVRCPRAERPDAARDYRMRIGYPERRCNTVMDSMKVVSGDPDAFAFQTR
jgi:hypothetical protein